MKPAVDSPLTGRNRGGNRLSADIEEHGLFKQKSYLRIHTLFSYRICISWFGGIQIHPRF
ncbi:MAG: hypothetical protein AAGJ95_05995 [Cyanobacteria bacterium J06554_11]